MYLEKQTEDEKNEARQLRAEQDELQVLEQQLLQTAVEDEEDDEESEQVKQSEQSQGQGSPTRSPALTPTEPTNEQLKAELERVRLQQEADRQALEEANELLA